MFGSYLLLVPSPGVCCAGSVRTTPLSRTSQRLPQASTSCSARRVRACSHRPCLTSIQQYADADAAIRAGLLNDFDLARRIAEDGLQGVVQNVAGAAWFLGMGSLLRRHRPALGAAAIAVGAFLVVNAIGIMVDVEALRFIGLTGNVLLAPAWAIGMGTSLLRSP